MEISDERLRALYAACAATTQSRLRLGKNIYSEEWDLLIILDACRVDALREVQHEYDYLNEIEAYWSRGSTSKEWLENTFVEEYIEEITSTAYITANSYSSDLGDETASPIEYKMVERTFGGKDISKVNAG